MPTTNLHVLPYPAVFYRVDDGTQAVSRVRENELTTPLDRLAQRIAIEFDVALVEIVDRHRQRTVVTGRCAAIHLQRDGSVDLPWTAQAAVTGVGGELGRLVVRDRAARAWSMADQYRLERFAHLVSGVLTTALAARKPQPALAG